MQVFGDTRFCFFRKTCQTVIKNLNKKVLQQVAEVLSDTDHSIDPPARDLISNEEFYNKPASISKLLTPVCKLINVWQDPKLNIADEVELWVNSKLNTDTYDETLATRISRAISPLGFAANMMHPKYKGLNLDPDQYAVGPQFLAATESPRTHGYRRSCYEELC